MRAELKKGVCCLLLFAMLFALTSAMPCDAWATEPDGLDQDAVLFEEREDGETNGVPAADEELSDAAAGVILDGENSPDDSFLACVTEIDTDGNAKKNTDASAAVDLVILDEAPLAAEAKAAADAALLLGNAPGDVALTAQVTVGEGLTLSLRGSLPDGADPSKYQVTAAFGGKTSAARLEDGVFVIPDAAELSLSQLEENITVTVSCGRDIKSYSFSIFDYLKTLPAYTDAPTPTNQAACAGTISGVGDFHAKLNEDGASLTLYFRAESVDSLRFACTGHTVGAPVQEDEGLYSITLGGVKANELSGDLSVKGMKGSETLAIQISPFCCAAAHWNEADVPLIALCRAIAAALAA